MKKMKKIVINTTINEQEQAIKIIDKHNLDKTIDILGGGAKYIFISVGRNEKLFTLWSFNSIRKNNQHSYIKNLSSNLIDAVNKAILYNKNSYIMICEDEVYDRNEKERWKFITFGKYYEHHIDDIIIDDPEYVVWMNKNNYDYIKKGGKLNKLGKYISDKISEINNRIELKKEKQAKLIAEKTTTQYVGEIGEKEKLELKLVLLKEWDNGYDSGVIYKFEDNNKNKFIKFGALNKKFISEKGVNNTDELPEVGDMFKFTTIIKKHDIDKKYNLGEKITTIGRLSNF